MGQVAAIGDSPPGTMDIPAGIDSRSAPTSSHGENVPVQQHVHDAFKVPTAFQNDANAAAYGEYWVGAGKGTHSMVLFHPGNGEWAAALSSATWSSKGSTVTGPSWAT